jgi:hypothetical protein
MHLLSACSTTSPRDVSRATFLAMSLALSAVARGSARPVEGVAEMQADPPRPAPRADGVTV